jgi:hypothetical protein
LSLDDVINNKPPAPSVRRPSAVSLKLSRAGFSRQFGRASAPMIPHLVRTIRGPNTGTRTSSGQRSALKIASWLHETSHRE